MTTYSTRGLLPIFKIVSTVKSLPFYSNRHIIINVYCRQHEKSGKRKGRKKKKKTPEDLTRLNMHKLMGTMN